MVHRASSCARGRAPRRVGAVIIPRPATHSLPMRAAKVGADLALWGRVGARRRVEQALTPASVRPLPEGVPGTAVLHSTAEVDAAVEQARRLRLPLHPTRAKNWDVLGAVRAVLEHAGPDARVLDAGAARYSTVLPSLRLYGLTRLSGINLEFHRTTHRGVVEFRPGDITATGLPDGSLDAVTCMSVIEHGVDVRAFLAESARVLRPGGVLVISTDYDQTPPDTSNHTAYGQDVHIFGPQEIHDLVWAAGELGLRLQGELDLEHAERPVHWPRYDLDYTFLLLTFVRE